MNVIDLKPADLTRGKILQGFFAQLKNPKNLAPLASFAIGASLLWWLLSQIEVSSAIQIIRQAPVDQLALGFLCYGATFYLRALRFKWLLPGDRPNPHIFPIVLVHYTALNIIPARLGEFSYVYLLKKFHQIPSGYSLSSLLIARIFDQIAISVLFLGSLYFVDFSMPWLQTVSMLVAGLLVGLFVAMLLMLLNKERCFRWLVWGLDKLRLNRLTIVPKIMAAIEDMIRGMSEIGSKKDFTKVFGLSLLIWSGIFSFNYVLLTAFGLSLSYLEIVLARTLIILLAIIPFELVSNIGVRQTAWTFIAMAMGTPTRELALVSALSARVVSTIFIAMLGLYGLLTLKGVQKGMTIPTDPISSEPESC